MTHRLRTRKGNGTYLALFSCFGAGYGISPIVAGSLLDARFPGLIWTIQLAAAALGIAGLVSIVVLRKRRAFSDS